MTIPDDSARFMQAYRKDTEVVKATGERSNPWGTKGWMGRCRMARKLFLLR